jgi:hypothetical protein
MAALDATSVVARAALAEVIISTFNYRRLTPVNGRTVEADSLREDGVPCRELGVRGCGATLRANGCGEGGKHSVRSVELAYQARMAPCERRYGVRGVGSPFRPT